MRIARLVITIICTFCWALAWTQKTRLASGKLFIIGGGDRPLSLMKSLMATAALGVKDYVVVLPMSSEEPDSAFRYFNEDFGRVSHNTIVDLNFTSATVNNERRLDSLRHARLIFITGGDQARFMKIVLNTPVCSAIQDAYINGSTIAGSSAGAAVMSKYMVTGNQITDTAYQSTFKKLRRDNIEIKDGLGLLTNAIVDQHFIVRSRYNRLISALAKYPSLTCIGIDEATAIIVHGNRVRVSGLGQVVVMRKPERLQFTSEGLIKLKDLHFSIYTDGDTFFIGK